MARLAQARQELRRALSDGLVYVRGQRSVQWYVRHGVTIGERCMLGHPFELDRTHCWLISIGDDVVFAPEVYVLAHDASAKAATGYTRIAPVRIGNRVFVGARSTILPGVTIGDDVIIGAASVVTQDVLSGTVAVGNPARPVGTTESYYEKLRERFERAPRFGSEWTAWGGITPERRSRMAAELGDEGFVI
ncbi:MAG TPA: acyltransferase [Solirubrobacteraceae bacterium]|nr:acyltransferase [Solirubrobacteraceae bacterium]